MHLLTNPVQNYAWGSRTAIADLQGRERTGSAEAELWLGAHPSAPSTIDLDGEPTRLDEYVASRPAEVLGRTACASFGPRLPYLLKVIAADSPLSLQVHPDAARAATGFREEEESGAPRNARDRNYKDPFHKPELVYALTRFEALCGFRDPADVLGLLDGLDVPGLDALRDDLDQFDPGAALRSAFTHLLRLQDPEREELVTGVARACARRLGDGSPHAREDATVVELALAYPGDPGVVASLLLNRVSLAPGQALFLPAGNVHAYLRGVAVEVMASSDNVLRGGLTPKHVDLDELLRVVQFSPVHAPYARPQPGVRGETVFAPPVEEFALSVLEVAEGQRVVVDDEGPQIFLCLSGEVVLCRGDGELALGRGASAFVGAQEAQLEVVGSGTVVRALTAHAR